MTIVEHVHSRRWTTGENATAERVFVVTGSANDVAVLAYVETQTPSVYEGLVRQSIDLEPEFVDETSNSGQWRATVRYGLRAPLEPGDSVFSFDTTGGTQHVTQSIATIAKYAPEGKTAPDFKGAIAVTEDRVEGIDLVTPVYSFSERHCIAAEEVDDDYKLDLFELTGRVNSAAFREFAKGEVLFCGAQGQRRSEDAWEITFSFRASLNATDLYVGEIGPISKEGWQLLWVRYGDVLDQTANFIVKRPLAAYVEKVYEYGDFSLLKIGS